MKAAVFGCVLSAIPSIATSGTIPAENVPTSMLGTRPDWKSIPDFSMECEGNVEVIVSHRDAEIRVNGGAGLKMVSSNATYQTSRDRFGNYVPVIAVDILKGVNWELAEIEASGVWIFNNGGRLSKCLPQ